MVTNNPTERIHPLTYDLLAQRGFKDLFPQPQTEIPRYITKKEGDFSVTLVQVSLNPPTYKLHHINLGKRAYDSRDPFFSLIQDQIDSLEELLNLLENPVKRLENFLSRARRPEISAEDLESEAEYLTPFWNKQY